MFLKKIYDGIDALAPFSLSGEFCEKYDGYDNSGILLECGEEVTGVLFALDCSAAAVARAEQINANCIVTHHPAIYAPLRSLKDGDAVLACARAGISVISAHLNLDAAEDGIDVSLMQGLGGTAAEEVMYPLTKGGYGRVYSVEQTPLPAFAAQAKERFQTERIAVYGEREVNRVASFCGAGMDEQSVAFALRSGADTFVSSDGKHHLIAGLVERGLNVVLLPHYAAEFYGFSRFYQIMKNLLQKSGVRAELFADGRFL